MRSLFTVQAGADRDEDTSVRLLGYDPGGRHLVCRLDDGGTTGRPARRVDPDGFVGKRELFVHYTHAGDGPSRFHRCRTGIGSGTATK